MKAGRKPIRPYMPMPNSSATRFVVQTAGARIIRMSISGLTDRVSTTIQATRNTTAASRRPSTRGEPQPHDAASVSGDQQADQPEGEQPEAVQLKRPGARDSDAGMRKWVATAATTTAMAGSQNSAR